MNVFQLASVVALTSLLSTTAFAKESIKEDVYVGFGAAYSTDESKDVASEYVGAEFYYGYQSNKYFLFELGIADYSLYSSENDGQDLFSVFGRFKGEYALNPETNFYLGTGIAYTDENVRPLLNVGVNHQFNDELSMDFGYQGLFGTNDNHMDVYGLKIAINYHF
ncbi:hypothetical protein M445_12235 [Vibrio owensii 47666-1]|uniref:outer membrane beta-barrel protein n=1 Tax=Vibrio owensii TaxID=696485 RepID=UPI0005858258|nr:outer membrane beta-barrel protein [Vibrio owensii]KIF47749.1 hypothetical protein M445_12235 [Vibrio owensii 47666-1]